jgi:hypothetical protein
VKRSAHLCRCEDEKRAFPNFQDGEAIKEPPPIHLFFGVLTSISWLEREGEGRAI